MVSWENTDINRPLITIDNLHYVIRSYFFAASSNLAILLFFCEFSVDKAAILF